MNSHPNSERSGVLAGWLILAAGIALLLVPTLAEMDMMGGGYALGFIGILVAAAGLVTLWIYGARAAALNRMLSGAGLLAHWTYDPSEAQRHAREQYEERRLHNRNLFFLVAAMMLVAGAIFLIYPILRGEDLFLPIVAVYFGAILLIGLVAFAAPRLEYRRALRSAGDAWIAREGVYLRGELHAWKAPFSRLERVRLARERAQPVLEFNIGQLSRVGWLHYETETVRVPVPAGQEEKAEEIVNAFGK